MYLDGGHAGVCERRRISAEIHVKRNRSLVHLVTWGWCSLVLVHAVDIRSVLGRIWSPGARLGLYAVAIDVIWGVVIAAAAESDLALTVL